VLHNCPWTSLQNVQHHWILTQPSLEALKFPDETSRLSKFPEEHLPSQPSSQQPQPHSQFLEEMPPRSGRQQRAETLRSACTVSFVQNVARSRRTLVRIGLYAAAHCVRPMRISQRKCEPSKPNIIMDPTSPVVSSDVKISPDVHVQSALGLRGPNVNPRAKRFRVHI